MLFVVPLYALIVGGEGYVSPLSRQSPAMALAEGAVDAAVFMLPDHNQNLTSRNLPWMHTLPC